MNDYDVEEQRIKAIATLEEKKAAVLNDVKSKYPASYSDDLCVECFAYVCADVRQKIPMLRYRYNTSDTLEKSKSIIKSAHLFVKLERLIERLKQGEDPRALLYEVVSTN